MTEIALSEQLWLMKSEPDVYGWDDLENPLQIGPR
jgi:predicted RNA-binding protein with PUA-like domain